MRSPSRCLFSCLLELSMLLNLPLCSLPDLNLHAGGSACVELPAAVDLDGGIVRVKVSVQSVQDGLCHVVGIRAGCVEGALHSRRFLLGCTLWYGEIGDDGRFQGDAPCKALSALRFPAEADFFLIGGGFLRGVGVACPCEPRAPLPNRGAGDGEFNLHIVLLM